MIFGDSDVMVHSSNRYTLLCNSFGDSQFGAARGLFLGSYDGVFATRAPLVIPWRTLKVDTAGRNGGFGWEDIGTLWKM